MNQTPVAAVRGKNSAHSLLAPLVTIAKMDRQSPK